MSYPSVGDTVVFKQSKGVEGVVTAVTQYETGEVAILVRYQDKDGYPESKWTSPQAVSWQSAAAAAA